MLNSISMKCNFFLLFILLNLFVTRAQNFFLHQGAFNGQYYEYGYNSLPKIEIKYAPEDIDWNRWSLLEDGEVYRLYFMPLGKSNKLYQFGFNPSSNAYEYGYMSAPVIPILDLPSNADVSNFSILFDGYDYRLYFLDKYDTQIILQCAYDENTGSTGAYRYGYKSISKIVISNAPIDTDWNRWSMLHDGKDYRLYFMSKNSNDLLYQFAYNGSTYDYGFNSMARISITGYPSSTSKSKFSILHDGVNYRLYKLQKNN